MEALVKRVENLVASLTGPASAPDANLSPASRLAAMLKEALAANTIGGKVEDDSRWRAAAEELRQAQAAWSRLGPVPDAARRPLVDRFQRASRRISERAEAAVRSAAPAAPPADLREEGRAGEAGPKRASPRQTRGASRREPRSKLA